MSRERFFDKKFEFLTLAKILEITNGRVAQDVDLSIKIFDIASLEKAQKNQLSFFASGQYLEKFSQTKAGFCFVEEKYLSKTPQNCIAIIHDNPNFAFSQIISTFYQEKTVRYSQSNISQTAKIGKNCSVAANAFIGDNVVIGDNCEIGPNSSILDNCVIGNNCRIYANVVISFSVIGDNCIFLHGAKIGQDGFGFAHHQGINHKILQIGIVEIHSSVEVGANSCIDRGAMENTIICEGVKIDNLVQIAHNVVIGKSTVMPACTAIAGSTKIGSFVQIGGAANIAGHLKIGDGVKIAAMSGVMRDIEDRQIVGGAPALPIRQWHKINAKLFSLIKK
jgi:UDP-3-O-[3-hydroxymyristoyl] glucosamine N-acyltransferase